MVTRTGNYHAYLLRLWRDDHDAPWRATLQNPHTGETLAFATMAELYAFLQAETAGSRETPPDQGAARPWAPPDEER